MPIAPTDIQFKLSGGASNADPNASLGGIISATGVNTVTTMDNVFDNVLDSEALAGDVEYRCLYVKNNHGSLTLANAKIYVASNTPSADTAVQIGVDPIGTGDGATTGVATTIANENTAPSGVTFSSAATSGAALALGSLGPGVVAAFWIKRTVNAAAAPFNNDPSIFRIIGDN